VRRWVGPFDHKPPGWYWTCLAFRTAYRVVCDVCQRKAYRDGWRAYGALLAARGWRR